MYRIYNLTSSSNVKVTASKGPFMVLTHLQDLDPSNPDPTGAYFSGLLSRQKRQLICSLKEDGVQIRQGMMQWMCGECAMTSNVGGIGGYLGRKLGGKMTGQNMIAPLYSGTGTIVLEPVDGDIYLLDLEQWQGGVLIDPDLFLACTSDVRLKTTMRRNLSSALFGSEGMFSMAIEGSGTAALKVPCPSNTLVIVELEDDVLKLDGNFAIAWSDSLEFSVETSGSSLTSSAISKQGFSNTYRGTGRILLSPLAAKNVSSASQSEE